MSGPLTGIRVIEMTTVVLGPLTTQLLGDLGADVIKVEAPEGDPVRYLGPARNAGMAALFLTNNRNKRSVVLDLKKPKARAALTRLIETSDVFVHNMRPNAAQRLKIGYADLARDNPRLIYASATGYRMDGPLRDAPAFDDVIQGWSGVPDLFMKTGREAQYAPFALADKVAGYMLALAIGMALFHRQKTGQGQEVHVPMLETMVAFNLHEHLWGGVFQPAIGPLGYSRMKTPYRRPFKTKDSHICVMPVTDAQWNRLLVAIDRPDLLADERFARMAQRGQNFDALYGHVSEELGKRTTAEWSALFQERDVPFGPVSRLEDLLTHDYFAGSLFQPYEHPTEGTLMGTTVPVYYSASPGDHARMPAPRLGEHTSAVLESLGYEAAEIEDITSPTLRSGSDASGAGGASSNVVAEPVRRAD